VTTSGSVTVEGKEIRWSGTGSGNPELVLVHGGSAHAAWWQPTLRALAGEQRIVTLDLSGHGDSAWRDAYPTTTWADEVAAVLRAATSGRAVVVAHSLGGRISAVTAARHPDAVEALVLVDSAVPAQPDDPVPAVRPARHYPTREDAQRAFRLLPGQPSPPAAVMEEIARTSVVAREQGWTWKFDPRIFGDLRGPTVEQHLASIACPVVAVNGELSAITSPSLVNTLAGHVGRPIPLVTVAGAHHHVLLDAPEALAAILGWLPETRPRP
jgi:pimeloyl-ACP methyl ester carboxylesterase